MSVRSQNGWPAYPDPDTGRFVRFTAAGRGWWAANADVAVVFTKFVTRFDREVEKVVRPGEPYDDWSFADRLVRGSTATVSNHGSATAIDINATRHLLGRENTFLPTDEAALKRIVDDITDDAGRPVLRWGGSYSGRKDEMHIEINATPARVRQAANKIRREQEEEMPTVAEIVAGLRPTIRAEVRAQIIDVLQNEPLITNKATAAALAADPDAASSKASISWFLSNIEADQDNDRNTDQQARARLEGKVDQLLQLLAGPDAPDAG